MIAAGSAQKNVFHHKFDFLVFNLQSFSIFFSETDFAFIFQGKLFFLYITVVVLDSWAMRIYFSRFLSLELAFFVRLRLNEPALGML